MGALHYRFQLQAALRAILCCFGTSSLPCHHRFYLLCALWPLLPFHPLMLLLSFQLNLYSPFLSVFSLSGIFISILLLRQHCSCEAILLLLSLPYLDCICTFSPAFCILCWAIYCVLLVLLVSGAIALAVSSYEVVISRSCCFVFLLDCLESIADAIAYFSCICVYVI